MEILFKYISGAVVALLGMLCPVTPLIASAMLFITIDFITGVLASRAEAKRAGEVWHLQSRKAWRTVSKAGFVALAIVMMWIIDSTILGFMSLNLVNIFTGFVCGVELWSFIENAARISGAPLFEWISRWIKRRIGKEVGSE
jgi:phage-related holin